MLLSRLSNSFFNFLTTYIVLTITLFDNKLCLNNIGLLPFSRSYLIKILRFVIFKCNPTSNEKLLSSIINFTIQSKRFDGPYLKSPCTRPLITICFFLCLICRIVLLVLSLRCLARVLFCYPVPCICRSVFCLCSCSSDF